MDTLTKLCKNLRSFEMNVLKTTSFGKAEWDRDAPDAEWKGGISRPEGEVPNQPDGDDVPKELKEVYEAQKTNGEAKEEKGDEGESGGEQVQA
jgi:hypothetical protein